MIPEESAVECVIENEWLEPKDIAHYIKKKMIKNEHYLEILNFELRKVGLRILKIEQNPSKRSTV